MRWLYRLEAKYGRKGIPNLIMYICATMLAIFVFDFLFAIRGVTLSQYLSMSRALVLQGEIWRLVTFLILPSDPGMFFFITVYFYYSIGTALESYWGTFYFNLYYFTGCLGAMAAAMITGFGNNSYLYMSLLLAFAQLYPDQEFYLFFMIPVKARYIGIATWIIYAINLAFALLVGNWPACLALIISLVHFFLFFGPDFISRIKANLKYRGRRREFKKQMKDYRDTWR